MPHCSLRLAFGTCMILALGCSSGAKTTGTGSGGGAATGGATGTGGAGATGGATSASGGKVGTGGATASGGTTGTGGVMLTGGASGATGGATGGAGGATGGAGGVATQPLSPFIVVDQFGYRPNAEKVAVIRSPQVGFDNGTKFTPGGTYALVDAHSGQKVLEAAPAVWNGGATDASSGDKAWWFDFTSVTTPGDYFVLDESQSVRSDVFTVADTVYRDVLAQSVRMLYYQRDGFAKDAQHAGADWVDGAAHVGQCYLYSDAGHALNRDLHGGWWDAGDFNKYTNWGASDVITLMRAYEENPMAFVDTTHIPESGNGVPDLLDEVKWELDWLVRMQSPDGGVLSIVDEPAAASPAFSGNSPDTSPSKVTTPCKYGPATTSASLSTAAAFAYASRIFKSVAAAATAYPGFTDDLANRAKQAADWAKLNPAVFFYNSQNSVGSGEQEVAMADPDRAYGLMMKQLEGDLFLFQLTGDTTYRDAFDAKYSGVNLIKTAYAGPYNVEEQETLLAYAATANATASVAQKIKAAYKSAAQSGDNLGSVNAKSDPYMAFLSSYVWGSNQIKADQGNLLYDVLTYGVDSTNADAARGAERYVHYIHGVNPLQLVYLSNMGAYGASKSVTRFFHSWFGNASNWDAAGVSKYGPPPGYLTGGPNPSYTWDSCCPGGCSGNSCGAAPPAPPTGQPNQKSYKDFNDGWPLDSWAVTEPDDGYQAKYVRLLSKFVK